MKKLAENMGETLVETLAAVLIVVLVLTVLPFAMQTAAKINARAESGTNDFSYSRRDRVEMNLTVRCKNTDYPISADRILCYEDNGYIFYDYETSDN